MAESDVELRIKLADERTLVFELTSRRFGYRDASMGQTRLNGTPRQHLDFLFGDLSQLARRSAASYSAQDQAEISTRIAALGQHLYAQLFSNELKWAYRRIRQHKADAPLSLLITSDEPWIPWELVKPFERGTSAEDVLDDPFFCEQFALTRWLAGPSPAEQLEVKTIALVAPDSGLSSVQRERAYIEGLPQRAPQAQVLPPLGAVSAVRDGLRAGNVQLWHMACHGNFVGTSPDRSAVQLDGGELRAEEIVGPVEQGIAQSQPLVLLNACHTGRQDFALTGLGGWAQQFVHAGVSAFIGTQWEAHDALAAAFAVALYEALWSGQTLGQAAHAARQAIKGQDATNPTWLAYAVYGHPGLQIWLAGQTGPQPVVTPQVALRPLPSEVVLSAPIPEPSVISPGGPVITLGATVTRGTQIPPSTSTSQPAPATFASQPADDFVYDAFVSYSSQAADQAWVQEYLVPKLEAEGLRICLDVRDFDPGVGQIEAIEHAVVESRRTIAVLSQSYMQENFQNMQDLMVQTLGTEEGNYRLLPIRFERDVQLPLRLRMLQPLYRADLEQKAQFWQKLIAAIRTLPKRR